MSVICIQIGQCGNQLGWSFFDELYRLNPGNDVFFRRGKNGGTVARALLVDMESKVVSKCLRKPRTRASAWSFDKNNAVFTEQGGSANNWARGYFRNGPRFFSSAIWPKLENELRLCNSTVSAIIVLQSAAGGTGSGVGTYTTHAIRSLVTDKRVDSSTKQLLDGINLVNVLVCPHAVGDVSVQAFNTILTLTHLYQSSDGILMFHNDQVTNICQKRLRIKSPSLMDLNNVIAKQMATVFSDTYATRRRRSTTTYPSHLNSGIGAHPSVHHVPSESDNIFMHEQWSVVQDALTALCAHPGYKLLSIRMIPTLTTHDEAFASFTCSGLLKHLRQMLLTNAYMEDGMNWSTKGKPSKTLASILYLNDFHDDHLNIKSEDTENEMLDRELNLFFDANIYTEWNTKHAQTVVITSNRYIDFTDPQSSPKLNTSKIEAPRKMAVSLCNSQAIIEPLQQVLTRAYEMFHAGAFLHQYEVYGMSRQRFVEAFASAEQILMNYQNL
eukprot:g4283.t1